MTSNNHPGRRSCVTLACGGIFLLLASTGTLLAIVPLERSSETEPVILHAEVASLEPANLESVSLEPARPQRGRQGARGAAPEVRITTPRTGAVMAEGKVVVRVTIADNGGGIGRVEWWINDAFVGAERRRWFDRIDLPLSSPGKKVSVEYSLLLSCGTNRIEVLAYNERSPFRSAMARVTVKWDGRDPATARWRDPAMRRCDDENGRFSRFFDHPGVGAG